jgi:hypothetical protein
MKWRFLVVEIMFRFFQKSLILFKKSLGSFKKSKGFFYISKPHHFTS